MHHHLVGVALLLIAAAAVHAQAQTAAIPKADGKHQPIWNETWTDILRRDLLTTYDKLSRPSLNMTTVKLGMSTHFFELDEAKSRFSVNGWVKMNWMDPKLRWNPADYGNTTLVHGGVNEIWVPDIYLYNNANGQLDYYGNTQVLIYSNGSVLWVPPTKMDSFCRIDLSAWPYDEHKCTLKMGSWTYSDDQVHLIADDLDIYELNLNIEWKVLHTDIQRNVVHYNCCEEAYSDITFTFDVKRNSDIYRAIVVTPAAIVVLLALANFWLPAASGEKILLNSVNVVVIVSFLLYFARRLPSMGLHTPYVVLFFSNSLYLTSLSIILSVAVLNIARNRQTRPVPWLLRSLLDGWLGKVLLLHWLSPTGGHQQQDQGGIATPRTQEMHGKIIDSNGGGGGISASAAGHHMDGGGDACEDGHDTEDQHIIRNHLSGCGVGSNSVRYGPYQHYWIMLATAIDRLAFLVYALVFVIMAAVCAL